MFGFAQQEGKREGGHAWCVVVVGKGLNESLVTGRRAAAAAVAHAQMKRTRGERDTAGLSNADSVTSLAK